MQILYVQERAEGKKKNTVIAVLLFFNFNFFFWFKEKKNKTNNDKLLQLLALGSPLFTLCISPIFSLLLMSLCSASNPLYIPQSFEKVGVFFSFLLSLPTFLHSEIDTHTKRAHTYTQTHADTHTEKKNRKTNRIRIYVHTHDGIQIISTKRTKQDKKKKTKKPSESKNPERHENLSRAQPGPGPAAHMRCLHCGRLYASVGNVVAKFYALLVVMVTWA